MSKHIVVGGGLAGLMATLKLAEAGHEVELFSVVPVKRSHSVCAQGGINGAVNIKGEDDSPELHFYDTVKGGDFLAEQPPARAMCHAAPAIIHLLDRMGVMFNRTPEGNLDFRRFGGTLHHRTAFAGATTGQQLLYALDEQVRRHEVEGRVRKREGWEVLSAALDGGGACRGVAAMDLKSMKVEAFGADSVIVATGGLGMVYRLSTNSVINTGSLASALWQQGATLGNPEMIQVHPTAIPGADKLRLMSESARGEGGRVWVPRQKGDARPPKSIPEAERWYFLEEKYPRFKNLVPRDVASREIHKVCVDLGLGVGGGNMVYLDLSHIDAPTLRRKLGGILEIYEKFTGEDPTQVPMKIFPAVHYSMGGLWVDYERSSEGLLKPGSPRNQATRIPGLYAAGECDYQYHGANRLGANSLLSCLFAGQVVAPAVEAYAKAPRSKGEAAPHLEAERLRQEQRFRALAGQQGTENPYRLHEELGALMVADVTIVRENARLKAALGRLGELKERFARAACPDASPWHNQPLAFMNQLGNMIEISRAITAAALARDESRGAHYKPEFPERDDARWLKTTLCDWSPEGPKLSYAPVDVSLINPVARKYD